MAKVASELGFAPKLLKPIPSNPPMEAFDPKYLERKAAVGEKTFALKNGRQFCYFTEGNPEDPAVLCLHGASLSKWNLLQPEPLPGVFLIVPDRMGHGGSSPYNGHVPDLTKDVPEYLELLDNLKVDKFYVMGHSWGALSAIQIAAAYPDRVLACASLSAPCFPYGPGVTKEECKTCDTSPGWFVGLNKSGCYPAFGRYMIRKIFGGMAVTDKTKDFGMANQYKMQFENKEQCGDKRAWDLVAKDHFYITCFMDSMLNGANRKDSAYLQFKSNWRLEGPFFDLSKIQCPTFIYNGKDEATHLTNAKIWQRNISGSELIVLEEYGHAAIGMEAGKVILALVQKKAILPNY